MINTMVGNFEKDILTHEFIGNGLSSPEPQIGCVFLQAILTHANDNVALNLQT